MTAAEYRALTKADYGLTEIGKRLLAALEEREALLEQAKFGSADASVGALVRRIREHKADFSACVVARASDGFTTTLTEQGLSAMLRHLDSLLPKEPEVVTGPSGYEYRTTGPGGRVMQRRVHLDPVQEYVANESHTPPCDAPVVAKLLGGKDG